MASKKETLLKDLTVDQLKSKLVDLYKEHQIARFDKVAGDAAQASKIKKARKDIARVKTYLRQYELGIKK